MGIGGIDGWEFYTERYFGTESREFQEQRVIDLLPEAEAPAPIIISPESSKVSVCQGPVDTAPAPSGKTQILARSSEK